ncbi:MAG: hypothetical protein HYX92_04130 [Chloroflexi bacterium]|nr:hypothetical protein [Chloroflexota bacterium]
MTEVTRSVELMDPRGEPQVERKMPYAQPARLTTLHNRTIGLLDNSKGDVDLFLADLGELLCAECPSAEVIQMRKPAAGHPVPDEVMRELLDRCDAIVTGIGD